LTYQDILVKVLIVKMTVLIVIGLIIVAVLVIRALSKKQPEPPKEEVEQEEENLTMPEDTVIGLMLELLKAKALMRKEEDIKAYGERNFKIIISGEEQIIKEYDSKILSNPNFEKILWLEAKNLLEGFKKRLPAKLKDETIATAKEMLLSWYEEPLKELRYAKEFVARGGIDTTELEKELAREKLQTEIFKLRQEFEKKIFSEEKDKDNEEKKKALDEEESPGKDS